MKKIQTSLIESKYTIQSGEYRFIVMIDECSKRLRLLNSKGDKEFAFWNSKPEVVESVAKMFLAATHLVKKDINSLQEKHRGIKSK